MGFGDCDLFTNLIQNFNERHSDSKKIRLIYSAKHPTIWCLLLVNRHTNLFILIFKSIIGSL